MKNRREFLGGLAGAAAAASIPGALHAALPEPQLSAATSKRPNIIFFLVDDLGWGDFSCYGSTFHETPNIDKLASEGMKFTHAYAAGPVCSPSRAAIMSGQYPARLQLTDWIPGSHYPHKKLDPAPVPSHLPKDAKTLGERFKQLGYQTGAIGKWHLGGEPGYFPEDRGFDSNTAGGEDGSPGKSGGYFGPFHFHNLTGYTKDDYLTEVLSTKSDEFLEHAAPKGPFFLYMAEYAVHIPLQERQALVDKYRRKNGGKDEPDPVYAAMVESVDTALGRMRAKLKELGVADNTIIILTSDNGGVGFQGRQLHRIGENGPFRAGKGYLYEGGIREPLIVHWPGVTKPGSLCDVPVIGMDFTPTLLALAHGEAPQQPCDGIDFSGLLRGESKLPRETLYWHYPHYSDQGGPPAGAILDGDWKLIEFYEDDHLELYNLVLDPGEQYDFSSSFQDKASELHRKLVTWRESVHAVMPKRNPEYDASQADVHVGPLGCSAHPVAGCIED
jgi:arylsulfatase A